MKIPSSVNEFLNKPMDRRDFLKHVSLFGLYFLGAGAIIRSVSENSSSQDESSANLGSAYGLSKYGS